jgi:hypothetical protein
MKPSGVIFAALDCDDDAIEDWNRWYDLEHTPPNVLLDGVMLSNRYVALPAHHSARTTAAGSPFAEGRATFLTLYTLTGDPGTAFAGMSTLREQLIAQGRMAFPENKKAVREGDCFAGVHTAASAPTRLIADDVPLVGHTGIVIRQRRGGSEASLARADRLVGFDFVMGVWCLESRLREGIELDIVFVDGNAADAAIAMRAAEPADASTEVLVDAPFDRINPMNYPWADTIRNSDLPATIG